MCFLVSQTLWAVYLSKRRQKMKIANYVIVYVIEGQIFTDLVTKDG